MNHLLSTSVSKKNNTPHFKEMSKILSECPINKIQYALSDVRQNAKKILEHLQFDETYRPNKKVVCPFLTKLNKNNGSGYYYGQSNLKNASNDTLEKCLNDSIAFAQEIGLESVPAKESKTIILGLPKLSLPTPKNIELLNDLYAQKRNEIKEHYQLLIACLHPNTTNKHIITKENQSNIEASNRLLQTPFPTIMVRNIVKGDKVFSDSLH